MKTHTIHNKLKLKTILNRLNAKAGFKRFKEEYDCIWEYSERWQQYMFRCSNDDLDVLCIRENNHETQA